MANESRRRAGQEIASETLQTDAKATSSLYKGLAVGATSIRLIRIQRADNFDDPICCEIFVAPFKDKPRFEALSYKWGSNEPNQCILLNNVVVEVGRNLSEALHYLRRHESKEMSYWIDALCINQRDVAERNQQVGIMRHIYFRASTVLIWLGQKYDRHCTILPKLETIPEAKAKPNSKNSNVTSQTSMRDDSQPMAEEDKLKSMMLAKELYEDGYWNRVWIVQEIGLAKQLKVCLGYFSTSWAHFIDFMTFHDLGDAGPMKLNKQRQTKESKGCKLLDLVEDYRHARCTDQRDKIYGLLGLATDARHFPIDYNKSLFDIWKDVMQFAKARGMLQGRDIILIGRLVKFTLMGSKEHPLENLLRPYDRTEEPKMIIDKPDSAKVFKIPGSIIGCVQYVGPRIEDIVADPTHQETWEYHVQTSYQNDAPSAHHESEWCLRGIVDPDGPDLSRTCFSYTSTVQWTTSAYPYKANSIPERVLERVQDLQSRDHTEKGFSDVAPKSETQTGNIRLYQLYGFEGGNNWRFGIASHQVQLGDLICWVKSTSRALIIRLIQNNPPIFQAIGTAIVAADIRGSSKEKHADRLKSFQNRFQDSDMATFIDSTLIFILVGCGSPDGIF